MVTNMDVSDLSETESEYSESPSDTNSTESDTGSADSHLQGIWAEEHRAIETDNGDQYAHLIRDDGARNPDIVLSEETPNAKEFPLYTSCRVNQRQSEAMHLAKALAFNNSNKDLEASLRCTNLHLPYELSEYRSLHMFNQSLPEPKMVQYYYCIPCERIIDFAARSSASCSKCGVEYEKKGLKKKKQYFTNVSLREQLIRFLTSETSQHLRKECEESDIVNSAIYKKKRRNGVIALDDLSLTGFTDGVQPYKHTRDKMWPLAAHLLLMVLDTPARSPCQCRKPFNSRFGCPYCLNEGIRIKVGDGSARVYLGGVIEPRTQTMHKEHLRQVMATGEVQKGVLGPSILMLLKAIHIVFSFVPEYMHCGPLGVVKSFTRAWFLPKYRGKPFYLGERKMKVFNERMTSIKPTSEITRLPREYGEDNKASQMKNIAIYYSLPCLAGLMEQKYYDHWFLFVYGLTLCLRDRVSDDDRRRAKKAFDLFCEQIEELYGQEFKRFNSHLFEHITDYVQLFGALWAWSAFPFEHFNGVLAKCYHGTQHVPEQMIRVADRLAHLRNEAHIFNSPDCDPKVTKYFLELTTNCNITRIIEHGSDLRVCTPGRELVLSPLQKEVIEATIDDSICNECISYQRFIYKRRVFTSCSYTRSQDRINHMISTNDGGLVKVTNLICAKSQNSSEDNYLVIGQRLIELDEKLCEYSEFDSNDFSKIVRESAQIVCYRFSSIREKFVCIPMADDKLCLVPVVNTMETD
ncbi:hypothetical protein QAD02_009310 [Eretmocerus hayati]|uniref:Uncharacterized protein n=1 Tax=Eretmocerus hayati TaxID=131215 RepID=A0ACC2NBC3_9HYME|nr:hypothetical protein QAD02_009310 [Eretmocerus hayati]